MVQLPTGPTISCPWGASPVAVIATYSGGLVPVEGATVTLFYSTLASLIGAPMTTARTNAIGLAQACFTTGYFVQARIQKTGVDFGSGNGVQHIIGTKSGLDRLFNPTFFLTARSLPPVITPPTLPCQGIISITPPDFTQLLSGPALPGSIPVSFSITKGWGASIPPSIPLIIYIDDRKATSMTVKPGTNSIDILATIRSFLGATALTSGHRMSIVADLPDCNIPAQGLDIPALVPAALPCSGLISIVQPNFPSLLSGPALPGSIPVPVSITGTGLPPSIPLSILVDGSPVATATGIRNGSVNIDVLSIIRSLGAAALNTGHTIDIKSTLPDCNISSPPSINVPKLVPAAITQPCTEGETQTFRCPDGSQIVIARCKRDPATGINVWVPTGEKCPAIPPPELGKIVKILTYPEGAALEAFDGQDVTVTASVVCGLTLSSGETAAFEVDGVQVTQGTTSNGTVSFKWKATPEPSRTHKLCVSVPKSERCPKYASARDCKTITVSRLIPGIEERLRKEREEYAKGIEALRQERERIRLLPQPVISITPTAPYVPAIPSVPTIPTLPTIPTVPTGPEVPKQGRISIPSVELLPDVAFPVIIYIDGERIGSPPVMLDVDPGTHTVRIELKGFTPISRKINVIAGETTHITDLRFL